MNLTFITGNEHKFNEAKLIIPSIKRENIDLIEIQELDSQKIIEHKLEEASTKLQGNIVLDDVSFKVSVLNGFPGPLIKWLEKSIGPKGIYELVKDREDKSATVICSLGARIDGKTYFFDGIVEGQIVEPRGESTFGFDPIFMPNGLNKTYAEMTSEEIIEIKHRSKAFKLLKEFLEK